MAMTPLSIGLLAPPKSLGPPHCYGGTESVVRELARGLGAAGHDVVLYAGGDGSVQRPVAYGAADRVSPGMAELQHVMHGYEALAGCDVVHDHTVLGPAWALAAGHDRVVTTCHGPFDGELRTIYRRYGKRLPVVAISHDQAARAPEIAVDQVIHHGIDPARFAVGRGDGDYLLFLGRMTPDRRVREAVLAARAAGWPLIIAARVRGDVERDYFAEQVKPVLDGEVALVGEVSGDQKVKLLGAASALLSPSQRPDPFGLAMIEAMACGTPVITCPTGSATEIVEDGKTGFLCADFAGLVSAIWRLDRLNRDECRAAVVRRFTAARMVAEHLSLYRDIVME
jgi:glycosyltransferase involved in cell wall biosynthesis